MNSGSLSKFVRSIDAAAIAGLAYAVLSIVALVIFAAPPTPSEPDATVTAWYSDPNNRNLLTLGLGLSTFATISFLWFVAVIRRRIGTREDRFFATAFLGSGILIAGITLVGDAVLASPAMTIDLSGGDPIDPDVIAALTGVGNALLFFVLLRVQAVFVTTTSTLTMRTGTFSRYLSYFGYLIAASMFISPIVALPIGLGFPIWVAILSLAIVTRLADVRPAGASDAPPGFT